MKSFLSALCLFVFLGASALAAPGTVTPVPSEDWESPRYDDRRLPPAGPDYPEQPDLPDYPEHPGDGYDGHPGHPGRPPRHTHTETVAVKQHFFGFHRIPLFMLTNSIARLQGYKLVSLTIYGFSQAGMGGAFFCGSYCGPVQPVGAYFGAYPVLTAGEPLNPYSGHWFLELRGNFAVDSIQLEFVR